MASPPKPTPPPLTDEREGGDPPFPWLFIAVLGLFVLLSFVI
jgi:hypothetical protein